MKPTLHAPRALSACIALLVILLATLLLPAAPDATAQGRTVIRPISDFVDRQGTACGEPPALSCLWVPPVRNYLAWTAPAVGRWALVDYAGLANKWMVANKGTSLGTTTQGTITERPLADGRAEVTVELYTRNALTYGMSAVKLDPSTDPLLIGYRAPDVDVLAGRMPALSDSHLKVVLKNPKLGDRIPDLTEIFVGPYPLPWELVSLTLSSAGFGPLRPAIGVADGTPGRIDIIQTGLVATAGRVPGGSAVFDAFPAERISIGPARR